MKQLFILLVVVMLSGCKVMQLSDFTMQPPLATKLPALEIMMDKNPVNSMYAASPYYNPYYGGGMLTPDMQTLCDKNLKENITNPIGERYGYAQFKIVVAQSGLHGTGLYLLSVLTLGVPNLFGMPLFIAKTNLEVDLEILNSKREIVALYKAEGNAKCPVAMYYGYRMMSAPRMTNILSVKMALKSINEQIEKDAPMLRMKLIESGAIK
ncbi:MAG TPA: hypothetical protein VF411_03765 [Bacteroidia bacterium]